LGAVADTRRATVMDGWINGTFANEPTVGQHVGYGVFHEGVTYTATTVEVEVFQAAAGDVDGDREINNADLQQILGANSFNNPGQWNWTQGDFDGDTDVDNADLQMILATGLFGSGPYAADARDGCDCGQVVVPEQGTLLLAAMGILSLLSAGWRKRWKPAA